MEICILLQIIIGWPTEGMRKAQQTIYMKATRNAYKIAPEIWETEAYMERQQQNVN
jgi:hypothetical protein